MGNNHSEDLSRGYRPAAAAILLAVWIVAGLVMVRGRSRSPVVPMDLRFYGALRSVADVIWGNAVVRMATPSWVTSREAEQHYRTLRVIARLSPGNREIYPYGSFALSFWNRSDLALRFVNEGIARHPHDDRLKKQLYQVVALFNADTASSIAAIDETLHGQGIFVDEEEPVPPRSSGAMTPFLLILKATREEDMGRMTAAAKTWLYLRRYYGNNEQFADRAEKALARLRQETGDKGER